MKHHSIDLDIDGGTNMCKLLVSFFSVKPSLCYPAVFQYYFP